MRVIQGLFILLLTATASFAGSYQLNDWCFYSGSLNTDRSCNPNTFATPFDGSAFDTTFDTNKLGLVQTGTMVAGTYTVVAYYDFDLAAVANGSFNESASVTGTPGLHEGYFLDDPANSSFTEFTNANLNNTNNVGTASGLPNLCCDVSVVMGFKDFQIPVGFTGKFVFHVSEVLPVASWYITQNDPKSGDTIYFYQSADLTALPLSGIPEPATFLTLAAGLVLFLGARLWHRPAGLRIVASESSK